MIAKTPFSRKKRRLYARNIKSDYLPGNFTSVSLGEGSHRKVNLSDSLGSDVIENTAANLGFDRIAISDKFDKLNAARTNLEVAITSLSDNLTRFKPRSLSDANNRNGRADISTGFIKAEDAVKALSKELDTELPDSKEKQEELNNLKNAKVK